MKIKVIPFADKEKMKKYCPFSTQTLYRWRKIGILSD